MRAVASTPILKNGIPLEAVAHSRLEHRPEEIQVSSRIRYTLGGRPVCFFCRLQRLIGNVSLMVEETPPKPPRERNDGLILARIQVAVWRDIGIRLHRIEQPMTHIRLGGMEIEILAPTGRSLRFRRNADE